MPIRAQSSVEPVGHGHGHGSLADPHWLWAALAINLGFMALEVVAGLIAGSVALISDAAHMLTDAGAIALAIGAARLARRPPTGSFTFGLRRSEILSAQLNGAALLVLGALLAFESVRRIASAPEVEGAVVVVVGLAGAGANGAAAWALARANRASLNVEGAFLHNLTDLYASLAAAAAGAVVLLTGFTEADGIAALTVCGLMLYAGYGLTRDSSRVLMEAAPRGMEPEEIGRALAAEPDVVDVHDLHVWEVSSGFPALAAHVLVRADEDCHAKRRELATLLGERFGIAHTTLQVDHAPRRQLLGIEGREPPVTK